MAKRGKRRVSGGLSPERTSGDAARATPAHPRWPPGYTLKPGGGTMTPREAASPKPWAAFLVALGIAGIASADFPAPHDTETDLSRQRLSPEETAAGLQRFVSREA
jgi:hypothetical protein